MRVLLLVLAAAACTDFEDLPRGVCGNGLVEPGEDCDSAAATCIRCAVACAAAADCPGPAYACGVDGFCHAPGGALAPPSAPVTFQVDDLRVADIDRDGTGDVLGVSKTSAVVRFGDALGALTAAASFVTPAPSGPPSFGDLDGDGAADLTLETPDGLVTFTSRYGALAPTAIASPIYGDGDQPLDFASLFAVGPQQLGAFFFEQGLVILAVVDLLQPDRVHFAPPCFARLGAIPRASFSLAAVDRYDVAPGHVVVSLVTAAGDPCVMAIRGAPGETYTLDDVTPAGIGTLARVPRLADIDADGDPCPALINADSGALLRRWDGQLQSGRCAFAAAGPAGAALPPTPNAPASAIVVGRVPLVPAIPGVGNDALVLSTGVYAVSPLGIGLIYASSRRLARAAHGDLDGDGDLDAVLASADEDDLDILYRYPLGVELLRVDTASRATSLTIGDLDGNGVNDLAYTEAAVGHQRLMIAYGTADRPLPPVPVATFGDVASVTSIEVPDSVDTLNLAADLVVVQSAEAGGPATLSLLHGSPQRTMLSFFDPRLEVGPEHVLRGTVVGRFTGGPEADLFAIATEPAGVRAWTVAGTPRGLDHTPRPGTPTAGLADCARNLGTGLCVHDARYLAWPVGAELDAVLAIDTPPPDRAAAARLIDPRAFTAADVPAVVAGLPIGAAPRALHAADLDGDGAPELVAAFATRAALPDGAVRACRATASVPDRCDDVLAAVQAAAPAIAACLDAAPARLGGGTDLVALCRDAAGATALFRVVLAGDAPRAELLATGAGLRAIRAGDVTGDGVDDVVALQGDAGAQALVVYRQCTSRDTEACRRAGIGGAP